MCEPLGRANGAITAMVRGGAIEYSRAIESEYPRIEVAIRLPVRYKSAWHTNPQPMFIDIKEAVALSGRHANTIKRWGRAGKFKWSKPGGTRNASWSIDRESFIAFLRDEHDQPREAVRLGQA